MKCILMFIAASTNCFISYYDRKHFHRKHFLSVFSMFLFFFFSLPAFAYESKQLSTSLSFPLIGAQIFANKVQHFYSNDYELWTECVCVQVLFSFLFFFQFNTDVSLFIEFHVAWPMIKKMPLFQLLYSYI